MGKDRRTGETWKKVLAEICRIVLGATFIFSGTVKNIDPVGGALKLEDYFGAFGMASLNPLALFGSINLSSLEFVLGVCVLTAVYRRITTLFLLLFMSFMTLLTLYLAIFNPVHDCGCFGDALILTNWQTFYKNAFVLLPASVVVYLYHNKLFPLYSRHVYWFVALFAYLFSLCFAYWNYYNLPVMDFRPYKTGVNINSQRSIPEDAPQDLLEFIYTSPDGKERAFKIEELSEVDSTWTFKDSKVVKKGYVPPITSFELYDNKQNNIAPELLQDGKTVFLLVSPNISKASDHSIDAINSVFDYAKDKNIDFYCVTSSSAEDIDAWVQNTGAEYPFLSADDVTLKTIIRSNPGLVLLRSGDVMAKWHYLQIPSEETINAVTEQLLSSNNITPSTKKCVWIWIVLSFVVPLLLVWLYDYKFLKR
jgi:uncharacterized membrane protein YphA (DoxX/SURF4 family)